MAFLHRLLKCRRNAAAAVASASFLVVVLVFSVLLAATRRDDSPAIAAPSLLGEEEEPGASCEAALRSLPDHAARCRYLSSPRHPPCAPAGYVDYLRLFYCGFGRAPWLGGAALALWLLVLFYLLGDTASQYFCASLEGLSEALRLPPAIAGVTLLSLGNGSPDVLSSVVAFAAGGAEGDVGDVGLSSVLGGALFVSTVVAGVVAIVAARRRGDAAAVTIERRGFVRDVCFLLVALCYLVAVLLTGTVTVWAAASFLSLYAAYILLVWTSHCCAAAAEDEELGDGNKKPAAHNSDLAAPLLVDGHGDALPPLPVAISCKATTPPAPQKTFSQRALDALHSPLYLPRRLTIPDIAAHRWSKRYAVASALLAPLLLAAISYPSTPAVLLSAAAAGALLAAAAAHATASAAPPATRCGRLPWLAGGFLMSVLWSYMLARELVALLVAIGLVAGVKASLLGATVLAWGNSLGDLVADVALAAHGGAAGAQTAVSGCYAGPAFNTVVGLGLSLTLAAGARYPRAYAVPADASAYQAAGFLAAGLAWALVVLPARGMRLDRVLGVGLLVVYLGFLAVRLGSLGASGS
ncbi:cation/calcium exchanger 1-like [Panicum miliaceum]|uniref:Cation/calcium exchanger 1-like n=1 Tax=Panicum miliaceum TaxID=4540 RepID=A0A3L6SYR6_PANMI|nr:cation/calcium exchanger 1-like [Panicum miliaceum]